MKKIYSNFSGGLSNNDKLMSDNQFAVGRDVDIHRDYGYLMPGYAGTALTNVDQLAGLVVDFAVRPILTAPSTAAIYAIEQTKLHHITPSTDTITNSGGAYPHTLPANKDGLGVFFYDCTAERNATYYVMENNIGKDTGGVFDDDWLSTVPAGGATLNSNSLYHPYLIWNNYFWVGDYNKVGRFDGETGANGTWTAASLTLPVSWQITALFPTQNYIGICVRVVYESNTPILTLSRYRTQSFVVFWDGTSSAFNYSIPISDNKITSAINDNGTVYLFTENKDLAGAVHILQNNGAKKLKRLRTDVGGSTVNLTAPNLHAVESYDNKILIGGGNYDLVMTYGQLEQETPFAFFQPFSNTSTSGGVVGAIKVVDTDKIYVSTKVATTYTIKKYTTGSSAGVYKAGYTDFGQRIRINYIKYYFKPLVSGDSITAGIDVDYGTSKTLGIGTGNISFAKDGAVTSKKFIKQITCHAFRPTLTWVAGGTAFSKIVIDYDFLSD